MWIASVRFTEHLSLLTCRLNDESSPDFFQHLSAELFVLQRITDHLATIDNAAPEANSKLDTILLTALKNLRNSCALGATVQNAIISTQQHVHNSETLEINLWKVIGVILRTESSDNTISGLHSITTSTQKMCWQFVANLTVQNGHTQQRIWEELRELFVSYLSLPTAINARECTMILYNIYIGGAIADKNAKEIFNAMVNCLNSPHSHDNDFFHIFMEHILTSSSAVVPLFAACTCPDRLAVLYYIADYMRGSDHSEAIIHTALLQHICKEFKKKSDCVLKTVSTYVDRIEPKEVVAMMDVIAQASSDERYTHVLGDDGSLFLNVGCLLQAAHQIGKSSAATEGNGSGNIFAPVQKLDQIAPNSTEDTAIERDISYQLKSMLVRIIGNLAYKNKKNQDLVSVGSCFRIFYGDSTQFLY